MKPCAPVPGPGDAQRANARRVKQTEWFLLRNGFVTPARVSGALLTGVDLRPKMAHAAQQFTLAGNMVDACGPAQSASSGSQVKFVACCSMASCQLSNALQALRGVSLVVAGDGDCELGDLSRFDNAGKLMVYWAYPSEDSSGETTKGRNHQTGNGHARRMLVEAAWSYRLPPE